MLLLFDTASGFALFKVLDDGKVEEATDLAEDFGTLDKAKKVVKLKAFKKFDNTAEALAAATFLVDSKLSKDLKKFLKKNCDEKDTLALMDAKLGNIIKEKLGLNCIYNNGVMELCRGVRLQLHGLISQLHGTDLTPMSLGLSHSLSRYKLKFSPDKVDTMIIQAIGLLDDLDKELNTYAMRVREWYGWHFPEMTKIVSDNVVYAKTVKFMGTRENAEGKDFSAIVVDEEVEAALKEAAQVSMGTEISEEDLSNIVCLCDQVISLSEYRAQLFDYLKSRMSAIAPNLTVLVGELVGARLISHAGSLINLAKQPASTVQILGAEKALFRALKTKSETPKYGLIYHASLIGQSAPKFKGKISRVLAAKCALSIRVDALGDTDDASVGTEARAKVEARLRQLEGKMLASDAVTPSGKDAKKYVKPADTPRAYSADADVVAKKSAGGDDGEGKKKKKKKAAEENGEGAVVVKEEKKKKKKVAEGEEEEKPKKKKKKAAEEEGEEEKPKKKKKKVAAVTEVEEEEKPKKKAKKSKKEKE